MSAYCDECGGVTSRGICANCHEELYILEYQGRDIDFAVSADFMDAAKRQQADVAKRQSKPRSSRARIPASPDGDET